MLPAEQRGDDDQRIGAILLRGLYGRRRVEREPGGGGVDRRRSLADQQGHRTPGAGAESGGDRALGGRRVHAADRHAVHDRAARHVAAEHAAHEDEREAVEDRERGGQHDNDRQQPASAAALFGIGRVGSCMSTHVASRAGTGIGGLCVGAVVRMRGRSRLRRDAPELFGRRVRLGGRCQRERARRVVQRAYRVRIGVQVRGLAGRVVEDTAEITQRKCVTGRVLRVWIVRAESGEGGRQRRHAVPAAERGGRDDAGHVVHRHSLVRSLVDVGEFAVDELDARQIHRVDVGRVRRVGLGAGESGRADPVPEKSARLSGRTVS